MKDLKKAALTGLCLFMAGSSAFAFNAFEKIAQENMDKYLKSRKYETRIREDDHSINFMVGENLFWITMEGDANGMLYTLHRRPIKLDEKDIDQKVLTRRKEDAVRAAMNITANNPYKAYLEGNKVMFELPVYASGHAEYEKIFPRVLKTLNEVSMKNFEHEMSLAKVENENVRKAIMNDESDCIVLEQPKRPKSSEAKADVYVQGIDICSVDKSGNVLIEYDGIKYHDKMQFMKPRIKASATKPGRYAISVKIITPDGKVLVPSKGQKITMTSEVELSKKPQIVELGEFGTSDPGFWQGNKNYKVVILFDGRELDSREFSVL